METRYKEIGEPAASRPTGSFPPYHGFTVQCWGAVSRSTQLNKVMVAPKWGRITDSHLLKLHLENSTGFLVGEIASLDYSLSVFAGSVGYPFYH